ncbi:HU family DNA-binding protein [Pseudemcibacter aquimaris]|uniref:HU family DNA-binding protein n=1 Tax=Pseudemcibacter aquimaris TaxID=2857064 RepID=UPI002011A62B|nr:HU family DNA-binding protein [Pseudemcibacter aquimaris]MCC3860949.1 HU family DNA-binding protein [Pseudemcibacter aquimaris]WDU59767.1 HU family DNA-binding protein [Pseudemcibacter aquimaris]
MKKIITVIMCLGLLGSISSANAMNKAELIDALASNSGLNKKQATEAVNVIFAEINRAVARGERVMLPKFGTFAPAEDRTKGAIFIPETAMKVRPSIKRRSTN